MKLIGEKGLENLTTRLIAQEAGENEVTLFRRFGDKVSIVRALFQRYDPTAIFEAYSFDFNPADLAPV